MLIAACARLPRALVASRSALAAGIEAGRVPAAGVIDAMRTGAVGEATCEPEVARLLETMLSGLTTETLVRGLRVTDPLALPGWGAAPFDVPATLFHGTGDTSVPFDCGEELARMGRASRLVPIDTASHMLPFTHTAAIASELDAIVARHARTG
jgi:pimeloyl-ACP methyl ester carboxylesterase